MTTAIPSFVKKPSSYYVNKKKIELSSLYCEGGDFNSLNIINVYI